MLFHPQHAAAVTTLVISAIVAPLMVLGCENPMNRIDREVDTLLAQSTNQLNGKVAPQISNMPLNGRRPYETRDIAAEDIPTFNPIAEQIEYGADEAQARQEHTQAEANANDDDITAPPADREYEIPAILRAPADNEQSDADMFADQPRKDAYVIPPTIARPDAAADRRAVIDEQLVGRLEGYSEVPPDTVTMDLEQALSYSIEHAREYRFAEETYVLRALQLLIEQHRFGPRFFDDVSATARGDADDGLFDTTLDLVNEFRVTHRLPYGGEVTARAVAEATEDLHVRTAGEEVQSASVILSANIPLLRGAGIVAREDLIQAERDMVYAARQFERFRRQFLFDIARDFLDLVVQRQSIENAVRQVESFEQLEERARNMVDAGRWAPFELALAEQDTLFARDSLNSQRERYRVAVDRFKVRIGMPKDQPLRIATQSMLNLPAPKVSLSEAVQISLQYRLDLQTTRDQVDDSRRRLANARNALLPDLDFTGSVTFPTDPNQDRPGIFDLDVQETEFQTGLSLSLPLDRRIERVGVRQAQISAERSRRNYEEQRDDIAVQVRSAVRDIDRARFSLQIQQENIRIAERRQASIEAAPARATARDRSEAVDALLQAQNQRDEARRDLQIAILQYLLDTGQLRVAPGGTIQPLAGMKIGRANDRPDQPNVAPGKRSDTDTGSPTPDAAQRADAG